MDDKKSRHGMGRVYRHGNYFWADICFKGERRRERVAHLSLGKSGRKLAEAVLDKWRLEISEGKFLDKKEFCKLTFKEFAEKYMEEWSKPFKASWEKQDKWRLKKLVPKFGSKKLDEIEPKAVEDYMRQRLQEVSPRTVNMELGLLRAMLNKAVEWGFLTANPIKQVKKIKQHQGRLADVSRVRYLDKDEFANLLEHCDDRLRPIILLAVNTGLRKSEIQNLSLNDVDFRKKILTINRQKNHEVSRMPLNETACQILLELKRNSSEERPFNHNFRKSFETALRRSGIKDFHFHDLRHTFASWLVMAGVPIYTVKELMRHKDIKMTTRYAHLSPDHKMEALKVLESFSGSRYGTGVAQEEIWKHNEIRNSL